VPRFLSTVLVIVLLGGTAAAFAVTQGLKNQPSPITAPRIAKVFSPACDCATRVAAIQFRLRKPDRVRLQIVDSGGSVVRTLVPGRRLRRGTVSYTWNGRDDAGQFVPQGVYKPRVHLNDQHRTIDLPNEMRVDTTAPRISIVSLEPRLISPNGDGRNDLVRIAYKISEPAHAMLLVDGKRVIFTRRQLQRANLVWNGKIEGRALLPGAYRVWLGAEDRAGNVSNGKVVHIVVRYVQLSRGSIRAKAGTRFGVRVFADRHVRWRLAARNGTTAPGLVVLRAPPKPGRYRLVISVPNHAAAATVIVSPR
jgi:hypothetical protein